MVSGVYIYILNIESELYEGLQENINLGYADAT